MANIISEMQSGIIGVLKSARDNSADQNYPKKIAAYNGELENPGQLVRTMPMITVNLAKDFDLTADDIMGQLLSGSYNPDVILFEKNNLNTEETISDMAVLIDWTIEAIRGKTIQVDGVTLVLSKNIKGKYFPIGNAAILTLNIEAHEG